MVSDAKRGAQEALFNAIRDQAENNMKSALRPTEKVQLLRRLAEAYRLTAGGAAPDVAPRKATPGNGQARKATPENGKAGKATPADGQARKASPPEGEPRKAAAADGQQRKAAPANGQARKAAPASS